MKKSIAFLTRGPLTPPVFLAALMTMQCSLPRRSRRPDPQPRRRRNRRRSRSMSASW